MEYYLNIVKKIVLIGLILFSFICCYYILSTIKIIKNAEDKIISPDSKYFLLINKIPPIMSFGSGKTELRLYTSYYFFSGKCLLGEFPVEIEEWNIQNKTIYIKIRQHDVSNASYVKQFTDKNSNIGRFNMVYQVVYPNFIENIKY